MDAALVGVPCVRPRPRFLETQRNFGAGVCVRCLTSDEYDEDEGAPDTWFEAIQLGDLASAQCMLEEGDPTWVDVTDDEFDPVDGRGRTALHEAALYGHVDVVQWLLGEGANVNNAEYWDGLTPLHEAAIGGSAGVVSALLAAGAEVDARCLTQRASPLHHAASHGHRAGCDLLLQAGARCGSEDEEGRTAGERAAASGFKELAQHLTRCAEEEEEEENGR